MKVVKFRLAAVLLTAVMAFLPPALAAGGTAAAAAGQPAGSVAPAGSPAANGAAAADSAFVAVASDAEEAIPLFFDERVIAGQSRQEDTFFRIAEGRRVLLDSYVDLYFGHSPTPDEMRSTMTVLLDGVPVGSVTLDRSNERGGHARIDIGERLAASPAGFHTLSLLTDLRVAGNVCGDPDNPADWVVIHETSRIHLQMEHSYGEADLGWYPSPFLEIGSQAPLQSAIVVPDKFDRAEFAGAAGLAQYFSALAPDRRLQFAVLTESEAADGALAGKHAVWVGHRDSWSADGRAAVEAAEAAGGPADGRGFVAVVDAARDSRLVDMVVAGDEAELLRAVTMLTDERLYGQLTGRVQPVPAAFGPPEGEAPPDAAADVSPGGGATALTFEELGYDSLVARNAERSGFRISYAPPGNLAVQGSAQLKLLFTHSTSIDLHESIVSVSLNDVPVASMRLTEQSAQSGELDVTFDQSLIDARRAMDIDVQFEFAAPATRVDAALCGDRNLSGNWAVVDKASTLAFATAEREAQPLLEQLPYPFVTDERWNAAAFVLPERAGRRELSQAITVAALLAREARDNSDLSVVRAGDPELADKLKDRNVIYVGSWADLPAALNGFPESAVRFEPEGMAVPMTDKAPLLDELRRHSTVVQLSRSPFDPSRDALLLAESGTVERDLISEAFAGDEQSAALAGKLVVVDRQGAVHAFPEAAPPAAPATAPAMRGLFEKNGAPALGKAAFAAAFAGLALLLAAALAIVWRRRR